VRTAMAALGRGLSASGEDKDFFSRGRLRVLAGCLRAVRDRGFEVLAVDFMFIFPRVLRWLRPLKRACRTCLSVRSIRCSAGALD
jgi:hypothetical protein